MNIIPVILLVAISSLALCAIPKCMYDPREENPYRIRSLPYLDKNGELRYEDLTKSVRSSKANITDVTLHLFNKLNPDMSEVHPCDDFTTLLNSSLFNPIKVSYFLVHGQGNNVTSDFNTRIKSAILNQADVNLFVVDWSGPASEFYTAARNAVPEIGIFLGGYIEKLMNTFNIAPISIKMAGHGLGAHVCGAAGANLTEKINFILGLDASGPLFSLGDPGNRLDRTDASFVQVIHTNGELLGFRSALGHLDYYPNGGEVQPGCGIDLTGSCSQKRAYEYFEESLLTSGFRSYLCNSWEEFEAGFCFGTDTSMMGEYAIDKEASGDFFLHTNDKAPFALG